MTEIRGAKKLQRGFQKLIEYTDRGIVSTMLKVVLMMHRFAFMATHVLSGRMRNSLAPIVEQRGNDLVGAIEYNVLYAVYEARRPGSGTNNALGRATPHNALMYTHAEKGAEASRIFANDLNQQVRIATSTQ